MPSTPVAGSTSSHSKEGAGPGPVLFLLNALGIGGSERKTVGVVNALHRSGLNVHLAYLDARTPLLKTIDKGVPVVYLGRRGKLSFAAIKTLRAHIRREGISRVVCVSLYPFLYAKAAIGLISPRRKPSVILMVNATDNFGRKARMQMLVYRPLLRRAHTVVFGCRAQLKLWLNRYRLDEQKCDVIYNGIDEVKFSPGAAGDGPGPSELKFDLRDTDFVIGAIGTLWSNKNHIELVTALAHLKDTLPNARLIIAGEGPERERLEVAAKASGLSNRVSLLGELDDVRPILKGMDLFILPSISETFSNAALEAMAMEKVVILSDTGGMPEMVRHGVDGFCYEQGNIGALVALIEQLAADPDKRRTIGRKAREAVAKRFTFTRMVDDYRRLLS